MEVLARKKASYRTKALDAAQAERFARCLRANSRFTGVSVSPAKAAGKFYVAFNSAADEAGEKILDRQHNARLERALTEGQDYLFVADESCRFFWCQSTSGEVYEVSSFDCSCPDFTHRCGAAGIQCKHQLALAHGVGMVQAWQAVPAAMNAREAAARADRALWD